MDSKIISPSPSPSLSSRPNTLHQAKANKRKCFSVQSGICKKRRSFSITYDQLGALCFASKHIPDSTPKRWDLISTLVSDSSSSNEESPSPKITLHEHDETQHSKIVQFDKSSISCKEVVHLLITKYSDMFNFSEDNLTCILDSYVDKNALKHIILLPQEKSCCGNSIIIRNRPSFPLVYTTKGTYIAALFSGECRKCTKKFNYSYYHVGDQLHYYDHNQLSFFQLSSQTIFEIALIHDITNNISVSACSFQSRAEVHNENFRMVDCERLSNFNDYGRNLTDIYHPWKLTEKRVEDAWFLYQLVSFYTGSNELELINFYTEVDASQRKDLEQLCNLAYDKIINQTNPWVHHEGMKKITYFTLL